MRDKVRIAEAVPRPLLLRRIMRRRSHSRRRDV